MLLSSSNRKYPPFPLLSYFSVVVCLICLLDHIFCHLLHIRSGKAGNLFSLLLCSLWLMHIFGYVLACRSYSFVCTVHHLISIIVQTYLKALNLKNACQIYFVQCVSKIKHILSVIHFTICWAVCFQFTHFSCDDGENIYTLSYYHHQIGSMHYCPLFRVRSWNNGIRCTSFYILILILIEVNATTNYRDLLPSMKTNPFMFQLEAGGSSVVWGGNFGPVWGKGTKVIAKIWPDVGKSLGGCCLRRSLQFSRRARDSM